MSATMRQRPINPAESVIEPFWDNRLYDLDNWDVTARPGGGGRAYVHWGWLAFEWAEGAPGETMLTLTRAVNVDCARFDELLVSARIAPDAHIDIVLDTDAGERRRDNLPGAPRKREYAVPLDGASRIDRITLQLGTSRVGITVGWLNWIGLREASLLEPYLNQWRGHDDDAWAEYLKPASFQPAFTLDRGLLFGEEELAGMRTHHERVERDGGVSALRVAADRARAPEPESLIGEAVIFWDDTRFAREWDHDRVILDHGMNAALAGLVFRDAELSRLGARYAMSIAFCGRWDDGPVGNVAGSDFELRGFVRSLCIQEIALILDFAGEWFTDLGRSVLLRRISEEGEGAINHAAWKHEYMHHCNQIAWISPGRILGYLTLEREMPRVRPYTELAVDDLRKNIADTVMPDGGYAEGPTYLLWAMRCAAVALGAYARDRGIALDPLLPDWLERSNGYADLIASTDPERDMIAVADAQTTLDRQLEGVAYLAARWPDSQWPAIYRKVAARAGDAPVTPLSNLYESRIPEAAPPPPAWTSLPTLGAAVSVRQVQGETLKMVVFGNSAGADHTHEDKGSFVLEFAGQTFAMEPGSADYANPISLELKHCQRHNMLAPIGLPQRARPLNPVPVDIPIEGGGDAEKLHLSLDLTGSWNGEFERWRRTFESDQPDHLVIRDDYALNTGRGVDAFWQSPVPIRLDGQVAVMESDRARITVHCPNDAAVRVDELPLPEGRIQYRLGVRKLATEGQIEIDVRIAVLADD